MSQYILIIEYSDQICIETHTSLDDMLKEQIHYESLGNKCTPTKSLQLK